MNILLLEPYLTGSHQNWAEEYAKYSAHDVTILSLPGRFWKWRMHGGAVTLAKQFLALTTLPDIIVASDMLNLASFQALTRKQSHPIPCALYFHENQLTYPWSPQDRDVTAKRDHHYGFINYMSALAADAIFFNSAYHMNSFFKALPRFLRHFPDFKGLDNVEMLQAKASVLPLGLDLQQFDAYHSETSLKNKNKKSPLILWNHRWEYDKNPSDFFNALYTLAEQGLNFELAILGENFRNSPEEFSVAQAVFGEKVTRFGYANNIKEYAHWLWQANILPVTSLHDFFGASVVQAIYCGCYPLLPNRLVYPNLIPAHLHAKHIYQNQEDLVTKLAHIIKNKTHIDHNASLQTLVNRFDWSKMAPKYDNVLENLCERI